ERGRGSPRSELEQGPAVGGVGLAGQVTGLLIERYRPGQAGSGGGVVPALPLQGAELSERLGLAEPVVGPAGRGQGGLVKGGGLIPVTTGGEEAGNGGGDGGGMQGSRAASGALPGGGEGRPPRAPPRRGVP